MENIIPTAQYEAMMIRINELVKIMEDHTPSTDKNFIELDLLTDLVVAYEKEYFLLGKS